MTRKTRCALVVIGLAFCCWTFGGTASAEPEQEFANPEIRSAIHKQLESRYADLLNLDKSSFNTDGRSEGTTNPEAILVGGPAANAAPAHSAASSSRLLIGAALAVLLIGAAIIGSKRLRNRRG